jgi:hypothetical protein
MVKSLTRSCTFLTSRVVCRDCLALQKQASQNDRYGSWELKGTLDIGISNLPYSDLWFAARASELKLHARGVMSRSIVHSSEALK